VCQSAKIGDQTSADNERLQDTRVHVQTVPAKQDKVEQRRIESTRYLTSLPNGTNRSFVITGNGCIDSIQYTYKSRSVDKNCFPAHPAPSFHVTFVTWTPLREPLPMNRRLEGRGFKPLLQIFSCVIFTVSDHWVSYIPWFRFDHGVEASD
jgi:hypothetical protein